MKLNWLPKLMILACSIPLDGATGIDCETYLAPSTIPNAGLGIFSAIEKNPGDTVGNGDVCMPLLELNWHHDHKNFFNPFADYVWAGEVMGMYQEVESDDIEAYCPGLDCAINCNLALLNVEKSTPEYTTAGLHRYTSPNAGAITPYHNGTTVVSRYIPKGGELFKFYGDSWFTTRDQLFHALPLSGDYPKAVNLLRKYNVLTFTPHTKNHLRKPLYQLLIDIQTTWSDSSRTMNALPKTYDEAELAIEHDDIGIIHQPNATRSIEWLQQNGKCVDHIVPGISTLPQAGHGAFAKRDLPNNTIITGSPMHHLPWSTFMDVYAFQLEDRQWKKRHMIGKQLFLNYCFGNDEVTTLLLCPYGAGVNYINHNQTLANVKVQWSQNGVTSQNNSWFHLTPAEMEWQYQTNLAFDFVATRDIKQGEELFMDYGDVWEEAWQNHLDTWEPKLPQYYMQAHEYNEAMQYDVLRTHQEQQTAPYPESLELRCHINLVETPNWYQMVSQGILDWELSNYGFPCTIIERNDDRNVYTVQVTTIRKDRWDHSDWGFQSRTYTVDNVPRMAMKFVDVPYSTDLYLSGAFRHAIQIPKEMIPKAWKNVESSSSKKNKKKKQKRKKKKQHVDDGEYGIGNSEL